MTLMSIELVAAAIALWVVLVVRGYRSPASWWLPALLGLLEPALAYLGDTFGLALTSAVHGAVISGLESALVVVLAAFLLRETVTRPAVLAVVIALGGLVVLAGAGERAGTAVGDLCVAGGVLSASLYTVVAKRFDDGSDPLSFTAWQFAAATLVTLTVALPRWFSGAERPPLAVAPRFWLAAGVVGVAGFAVSFLLFNVVISQVDAGWAAVVLNLIPVFGVLSAVVFLGERLTRSTGIGALMVAMSVLYFSRADRRAGRSSADTERGTTS